MAGRAAPPLLEPYLALPPEAALIVLSGVVGASTNWLVLRYLSSLLGRHPTTAAGAGAAAEDQGGLGGGRPPPEHTAVLLVSFLRDYAFWRDGAGRLGVDLESLKKRGRFSFVDGLAGLFAPPGKTAAAAASASDARRLAWGEAGILGVTAALREAIDQLRSSSSSSSAAPPGDPPLARKLVLIVDQPDLLLAAAGSGATVADMRDMLLDLREQVHASIVTLSADEPLVLSQHTTLEREHASLVLSLVHDARMLLSLRLLDTGAAKDVSGILRITRGGGGDGGGRPGTPPVEEHEYLYHIGGDGGVKVFERGQ